MQPSFQVLLIEYFIAIHSIMMAMILYLYVRNTS